MVTNQHTQAAPVSVTIGTDASRAKESSSQMEDRPGIMGIVISYLVPDHDCANAVTHPRFKSIRSYLSRGPIYQQENTSHLFPQRRVPRRPCSTRGEADIRALIFDSCSRNTQERAAWRRVSRFRDVARTGRLGWNPGRRKPDVLQVT